MSDSMTIVKKLNKSLSLINRNITETQQVHIREYIDVGEWGLALETLCDFLYEDEISISTKTYKLLKELAEMLKMDSKLLERIAPQVVD